MLNQRTLVFPIALLALGTLAVPAPAEQNPPPSRLVVLSTGSQIAPGVESLPRVVAGPVVSAKSVQRINANLSQYDTRMKVAAQACTAPTGEDRPEPRHETWWKRTVLVTMSGPRYLSLVASDDYDCGGVHPASGTLTLTYDLSDGQSLDWGHVLPAGAKWIHTGDTGGMDIEVVRWPTLTSIALRKADENCRATLHDYDVAFFLWLDGQKRQLMASVYGLPQVAVECSQPFGLSIPELRALHVSSKVLEGFAAESAP